MWDDYNGTIICVVSTWTHLQSSILSHTVPEPSTHSTCDSGCGNERYALLNRLHTVCERPSRATRVQGSIECNRCTLSTTRTEGGSRTVRSPRDCKQSGQEKRPVDAKSKGQGPPPHFPLSPFTNISLPSPLVFNSILLFLSFTHPVGN